MLTVTIFERTIFLACGLDKVERIAPAARLSVARVHGKAISTVARFGSVGTVRHLRFPVRHSATVRAE